MPEKKNIDLHYIQEAKAGNQAAFAIFFNKYHKQIYYFILSFVKNRTDAEDLMMITFEKAFSKIKEYVPLFAFKTWLLTIAKNTSLDFIKSQSLRPYNIDISQFDYLKSQIENPEQALITKENMDQMWRVINKMPNNRRKIVIRRIHGLLCREICDETSMTISAVTGQLRYAKNQLNRVLTKKIAS